MLSRLVRRGGDVAGDLLCRAGLHWPRSWEPSYEAGLEELLCQRDDCRHRLARRRLPAPAVAVPLAAVNGLRGHGGEG